MHALVKKLSSRVPAGFITALGTLLAVASPVAAQTRAWEGVCVYSQQGIDPATGAMVRTDVATIQGLQCLIANVLSVAITLIGLAGFVMIIFGAFRYLLSGGNTKETEQARNTLTYSIIGLVVALSAFIILNLLANFTGVDSILNFRIPGSRSGL